jgi:4-amino-4-deoxy-L-arabinose transferase-like glycosyltransferase
MAMLIAVAAFAVRLGLAIYLGLDQPPNPGSDQEGYDVYAWNLAQGRGYRGPSPDIADQDHLTANCVPGAPIVWAGLYFAFGHRYDVIRVAQCAFSAIAVLLVFEIGRRCYGTRVGLIAAAICAVFPTNLIYTVDLLTEPLGNLWFLAFILSALWFEERPGWGRSVLTGVFLGITMLTRASCIFMFPLIVVWAAWQCRGNWRAILMAAAIPVAAVGVIVPWTIRNYTVFHEFIPLSTLGGSTLLQGNNDVVVTDPKYFGYCIWDTLIPEYREALQTAGSEVERDRRAKKFAVEWLRNNSDKWLFLVSHKLYRAMTPVLAPHSPRLYRIAMLVSWGPVLVLFGLAFFPTLVTSLRRHEPQWLIHLAILQFLLTSVIFFGFARYRQPIEPLCIILGVQGVEWLLLRIAGRKNQLRDGLRSEMHNPSNAGEVPISRDPLTR